MATLKSICQDALRDVGNQLIPSTIAGNSDATAEVCLSLLNRLGRELALKHDWEALLAEHSFATVAGTASYALPADFRKFARSSHWDRSQYEALAGPVSPAQWQAFQSSAATVPTVTWFRVQGGRINLYPTPQSAATMAYEYFSRNWCESAGGTGQDAFANDTDAPLLDEELLILGLKARFLRSRGEPYDDALLDYKTSLDTVLANDNGPGAIRFGKGMPRLADNIADTGYGG